jgi:hypothetical protein
MDTSNDNSDSSAAPTTAALQPDCTSCVTPGITYADALTSLASLSLFCEPHELRHLFKRMHMTLEDNWHSLMAPLSEYRLPHLTDDGNAKTEEQPSRNKRERHAPAPGDASDSVDDDFPDTQGFDNGDDIELLMPPQRSPRFHCNTGISAVPSSPT